MVSYFQKKRYGRSAEKGYVRSCESEGKRNKSVLGESKSRGERKMNWADGKIRCCWANPKNERYIRYHDEEWGIPVRDDRKLFEMLVLECFQAGLSWECVLNKRDAFCEAFDGFDVEKVCTYTGEKLEALRKNPGIIRNRLKIEAAVTNAQAFRKIQKEYGSFSDYLWHWTDGRVVRETGRTNSELSDAISKDLKKQGMKFVGTTVIYAYLQAVGVIWSHEEECFCKKYSTNTIEKAGML